MRDLIVLGGGPAGYLAAERAGHAGMDVLLIEERAVGGVCLNEGCIPTKAFLYSAKIYDGARHGETYGVHAGSIALNHGEVVARKNKIVKTLTGGVRQALAACKVRIVDGRGVIEGKDADGSFLVKAGGETHVSKRLLVATGSTPSLPPIPGLKQSLESGLAMTNREILDLQTVPERLVIVGGGVIGLEMAAYFNAAGSKVTVVEMLDAVGGPIDGDIATALQKSLASKGVAFETGAKVVSIGGEVAFEKGGEKRSLTADKVLVSIGRRPVTEGFGLETLHLADFARGIKTDGQMRAGVPGLYAAGDVTNAIMLAHVAYRQAEAAVNHMTGVKDTVRYDAIPSVIYTSPEVGAVGETEQSAAAKGYETETVRLPMIYSGRYLAENAVTDGFIKLVAEKGSRRIIGCHMMGSYASEIIISAGVMIETRVTVDRAKTIVFPHPTVCEVIREALFRFE